jgi:hypothetical protein
VRLAPTATVTRSNCTCARDPDPYKLTLAPKYSRGAGGQFLGVRTARRELHQGPQRHRVVLGGRRPHRLADRVVDHHDLVPHPVHNGVHNGVLSDIGETLINILFSKIDTLR